MSRYNPEYLTEMKREPMSINFIRQAIADNAMLEAKVLSCDEKYNLTLYLGRNITGIIEFDELEYNEDGIVTKPVSATSKVNKHIKFLPKKIVDNHDGTYTVMCSRKDAQKDCMENFIKKLVPGDIINARALRIMNYGIFCDIGCGIIALLPTNNISVTHVTEPEKIMKGVTKLKVVVKENSNPFKITLSHKELLGNWEQEAAKLTEGDIVAGMVLSVEDYGIFVRLSQNLSGLAEPTEINIKENDMVYVQVLNIKPESMKVRLNITERIEFDTEEDELEARKLKFDYVIDSGHIDNWLYSTETAKRRIETQF